MNEVELVLKINELNIAIFDNDLQRVQALLGIEELNFPIDEKIKLSRDTATLLNYIALNTGNNLLLNAAVQGKSEIVEIFIQCGADIKHRNNLGENAIDLAWNNKHYSTVLKLLEKDSVFPKGFEIGLLDANNRFSDRIKHFISERELLHDSIKKNDLTDVKTRILNSAVSKLYLNQHDQSALSVAMKEKNMKFTLF